jgi:flagellar hook-length control protein FliK
LNIAALDILFQAPPVNPPGDAIALSGAAGLGTPNAAAGDLFSILSGTGQQSGIEARPEMFEELLFALGEDSEAQESLTESQNAILASLLNLTPAEATEYLRNAMAAWHAETDGLNARPRATGTPSTLPTATVTATSTATATEPSLSALPFGDSGIRSGSAAPLENIPESVPLPATTMATTTDTDVSVRNTAIQNEATNSATPVRVGETPATVAATRLDLNTLPVDDDPVRPDRVPPVVENMPEKSPSSAAGQLPFSTATDLSIETTTANAETIRPSAGEGIENTSARSQPVTNSPVDSAPPKPQVRPTSGTSAPVIDDDTPAMLPVAAEDDLTVTISAARPTEVAQAEKPTRNRAQTGTTSRTQQTVASATSGEAAVVAQNSEQSIPVRIQTAVPPVVPSQTAPVEPPSTLVSDGEIVAALMNRTIMTSGTTPIEAMKSAVVESAETGTPSPRYTIETPRPIPVPGQITVRVTPSRLGRIRIDLRSGQQGIIGRLRFDVASARTIVERDLPELQRALAESGIRLERLEIAGPLAARDAATTVVTHHADDQSLTDHETHDRKGNQARGQMRRDATQDQSPQRRSPWTSHAATHPTSGILMPGHVNLVA